MICATFCVDLGELHPIANNYPIHSLPNFKPAGSVVYELVDGFYNEARSEFGFKPG